MHYCLALGISWWGYFREHLFSFVHVVSIVYGLILKSEDIDLKKKSNWLLDLLQEWQW